MKFHKVPLSRDLYRCSEGFDNAPQRSQNEMKGVERAKHSLGDNCHRLLVTIHRPGEHLPNREPPTTQLP